MAMGRTVYMLNMSISGIKNLEREIRIDFYGKKIDRSFDPDKSKIKVIYGENGAGKTAIVYAIEIVKAFVLDENYLRDFKNQTVLKELINKKNKVFSFRCEFVIFLGSMIISEYEVRLSIDSDGELYVVYESLKYKYNNGNNIQRTAFICENGVLIELNTSKADEIKERTANLLVKQSALCSIPKFLTANSGKEEGDKAVIYSNVFFWMVVTCFDKEDRHISYYQRKRLADLKQKGLPVESLLEELNYGVFSNETRVLVKDYDNYKKNVRELERFVKLFKPSLKKLDIYKTVDKDYYVCRMIMNYGSYSVDREFESTGIKHLIEMYSALKMASLGAVVFIDEMDANINSIMLGKIIEFMNYYGKGQLCFTSHNVEPMIVLKKNSKAIDFLTSDCRIVPWVKNGHYSPDTQFRSGMIDGLPFNIDASDFIEIFKGE